MPYKLKLGENEVLGKGKFKNQKGNTECVEFIRQATTAPPTTQWKPGKRVLDAKIGEIQRGSAIATFDDKGKYPTDALGKHAAIYLYHTKDAIIVLDQWDKQGEVKQRPISFNRPKGTPRSNDGNTFYLIEP
jgi:hypothetical protein